MSRPDVVHFTTVHPAGDTRIFHKECRTLADAGYRVTLVAPGDPPPVAEGVTFVGLPGRSSRSQRMALGTRDAARALRRLPADIYHFHDPELLPLAGWLRMKGKRVIYDAHESVGDDVGSKPYLPPSVARVLGRTVGAIEKVIGRRLTHVVVATPIIASQFPFPTTVVANYPILDEWRAIDMGRDAYLARPPRGTYVGVIVDERCRKEMLAAAELVHLAVPGFVLTLAGIVPPTDTVPEGPGAEYVGVLSRGGVADLLAGSRFGVVIMKALPSIVTSLPTKFFEYLAAGLPVIVSRSLRVIVEIVEKEQCGIVVDEDDTRDIAAAMQQLLANPSEAFEMGAQGRRAVLERYSWATEGQRLVHLYDRLLGRPSPSSAALDHERPTA